MAEMTLPGIGAGTLGSRPDGSSAAALQLLPEVAAALARVPLGTGAPASSVTGNVGPAAGGVSSEWLATAQRTMLDLGTDDKTLLGYLSTELADASPAEQIALQQLSDQRNRVVAALTQIIRSIAETARQVIGNIR